MLERNETTLMVVEDEFLVASGLELALQAAGYIVLEPIPRVDEALAAVAGSPANLALLDVNLAGHRVYPVADALTARHIPFIFLTGCSESEMPERFSGTKKLVKPFSSERLIQTISDVLMETAGTA